MSDAGTTSSQRCYRHAEREAYIRCQRCERLICPECMREASVGFHCPECVRRESATVRSARTVTGGRLSARTGVISFGLIGLNVAIYLATVATGGSSGLLVDQGGMLASTAVDGQGNVLTGVADGAVWRLLTSAFLHSGLGHLAFNMIALYFFGPVVERTLGTRQFVAAYLTAAVVASVFVYVLSDPRGITIGASGAVFGLFGLAFVLLVRTGQDIRGLVVLLVINAVFSLRDGISWEGHLGGLIAGAVLGVVLAYAPRQHRTAIQVGGFAAIWIVAIVVIVLRTVQLA